MVTIKDFASNSVMGVVRKIANYLCDTLTPKVDGAIDHLPARFNGTFNDNSRVLTMTIESQGTSTENLTAEVTIPAGGGSGGPTYSAGNGINITPANAIEIDTSVTATKQSVDTLQAQVGDAFTEVAIGADGKSLDFTALDGQINNIEIPSFKPYRYSVYEQVHIRNISEYHTFLDNFTPGYYVFVGNASFNCTNTVWDVDGYKITFSTLYLTIRNLNDNHDNDMLSTGGSYIKKGAISTNPDNCSIGRIIKQAGEFTDCVVVSFAAPGDGEKPGVTYISSDGSGKKSLKFEASVTLILWGLWFKITDID